MLRHSLAVARDTPTGREYLAEGQWVSRSEQALVSGSAHFLEGLIDAIGEGAIIDLERRKPC